jgi:Gamma-glutamyl phosphate reductase
MTDLETMGQKAQSAAFELGQMGTQQKNNALLNMANALVVNTGKIIAANKDDIDAAKKNGLKEAMLDRLLLTPDRINKMSDGLRQVMDLPDPIGKVTRGWETMSGLDITQERVPLGVIGMIYEARPNVTVDAAGLCFKAGNAVILRGGKEAINSNIVLAETLRTALKDSGINPDAVQLIDDVSHETAQKMMELKDYIDVLIPRGSGKFIKMVVDKAKVPIIETGAGNCHIYVDKDADLDKALKIIINAKVQRLLSAMPLKKSSCTKTSPMNFCHAYTTLYQLITLKSVGMFWPKPSCPKSYPQRKKIGVLNTTTISSLSKS